MTTSAPTGGSKLEKKQVEVNRELSIVPFCQEPKDVTDIEVSDEPVWLAEARIIDEFRSIGGIFTTMFSQPDPQISYSEYMRAKFDILLSRQSFEDWYSLASTHYGNICKLQETWLDLEVLMKDELYDDNADFILHNSFFFSNKFVYLTRWEANCTKRVVTTAKYRWISMVLCHTGYELSKLEKKRFKRFKTMLRTIQQFKLDDATDNGSVGNSVAKVAVQSEYSREVEEFARFIESYPSVISGKFMCMCDDCGILPASEGDQSVALTQLHRPSSSNQAEVQMCAELVDSNNNFKPKTSATPSKKSTKTFNATLPAATPSEESIFKSAMSNYLSLRSLVQSLPPKQAEGLNNILTMILLTLRQIRKLQLKNDKARQISMTRELVRSIEEFKSTVPLTKTDVHKELGCFIVFLNNLIVSWNH